MTNGKSCIGDLSMFTNNIPNKKGILCHLFYNYVKFIFTIYLYHLDILIH